MKNVWVRPFNHRSPGEKKLFVEWLYAARDKNRFDPKLFELAPDGSFLRCRVLTCFNDQEIVGFIPVTIAFQLESLAFKPGLEPTTEARALQAMQHYLVHRAAEQNISDAFFCTYDESVLEFAQRYGWSKTVVPMLNLHFKDLEPSHADKD